MLLVVRTSLSLISTGEFKNYLEFWNQSLLKICLLIRSVYFFLCLNYIIQFRFVNMLFKKNYIF